MKEKINPTEEMLNDYENQMREAKLQTDNTNMNMQQQQQDMMMQNQEGGIVYEQLELGEVLDKIHNLLRGYVLKRQDNGGMQWEKPTDNDLVIFSEYGINYVMGYIQWYLNKNTLLSNYDTEQINAKMEDLSNTLNDSIFMEYDKIFLYPTLDECKDEIRARIKFKKDVRMFSLELLGEKADDKEIEKQILKEMEGRIERELDVIKQQKIKNKLKRFESIMRCIQDSIHSTYQRAWKGQERTTLRQHIHISENKGLGMQMPQQNTGFDPFSIFRRDK